MLYNTAANRRTLACSSISLGVHAGAAAALFLGFGQAAPASPPAALPMIVEMAALPSAPPVPPSFTPPQPEQREATPKPVVEDKLKIPEMPKLAMNLKPEVVVPLKPLEDQKKLEQDKPAEETTHQAAPEAPVKDEPKAPALGTPSLSKATAEQTWAGKVMAKLDRLKRYPNEARRAGQEDSVYVSITVDRNGKVLSSRLKQSRGYNMLNTEVSSLVQRASPLPALPKEVDGNPYTFIVSVDFFLKRQTASR